MKTIETIIKSFKLNEMKEMLQKIVLYKITVTKEKNFSCQKKHMELYRSVRCIVDFLLKIKINALVADKNLKKTIEVILKAAPIKYIHDGKVSVSSIDDIIYVRY
ncbi:P-II family nitrogen regulator [Bartonella bacilliformis]|uniref:Nitrogen regulatory protein P-II n=1 Tax=Bartonella bacilliformis Ver097 TaxID=1293911 RepID=A0A072R102_BARBA|nr:hypothetical protein H710_00811 [Bartonella bacilliformis Ver097]